MFERKTDKDVPLPPPAAGQGAGMTAAVAEAQEKARRALSAVSADLTDAEITQARIAELSARATYLASELQRRLAPISSPRGEQLKAGQVSAKLASPYFDALSSELDGIEIALADIGSVLDHLAI